MFANVPKRTNLRIQESYENYYYNTATEKMKIREKLNKLKLPDIQYTTYLSVFTGVRAFLWIHCHTRLGSTSTEVNQPSKHKTFA